MNDEYQLIDGFQCYYDRLIRAINSLVELTEDEKDCIIEDLDGLVEVLLNAK